MHETLEDNFNSTNQTMSGLVSNPSHMIHERFFLEDDMKHTDDEVSKEIPLMKQKSMLPLLSRRK
jgi:DNA-directed RNA polymerase sigma subunit (sigma70/sigma32)